MSRTLTVDEVNTTRHLSSRAAAAQLGCGKSTVNKYRGIYPASADQNARILILDIESKPLTVYSWGLWNVNIGISQIVEDGGMICFAAKWLGEPDTEFYSVYKDGYKDMVQKAHDMLSECDILVTYNGDRYDIKRLNNEFLLSGMAPPKPFRSIDLFKTNKGQFDLPSRKLDYIAQRTDVGAKLSHTGFQLWIDCMNNKAEAWQLMEEYNRQDVLVTEALYVKLLPWLKTVPHMGMFSGGGTRCPYCGSEALKANGTTKTQVQTYDLFVCNVCDGWSRGNKPLANPQGTRQVA